MASIFELFILEISRIIVNTGEMSIFAMMKKIIRKYISYFLLLIIAVHSVPKELVHELQHHDDTQDSSYSKFTNNEVGKKHTHCDAFHFEGPVLLNNYQIFGFYEDFSPYIYSDTYVSSYFLQGVDENSERGPPQNHVAILG